MAKTKGVAYLLHRFGVRRPAPASPFLQPIFHDAAIKLAAMIVAVDERPGGRDLEWIKLSLDWNDLRPQAKDMFDAQLSSPAAVLDILTDFLAQFGKKSIEAEHLLKAICSVATADRAANVDQILVLRTTGEILGLRYDAINRVLVAAGISLSTRHLDQRVFRKRGPSGHGIAGSATDRAQHLSTLGLPSGATQAEVKTAYRKLAMRYHPDRLAGRGVSDKDMQRAQAILVKLNTAYTALSASS